MSSNMSDRSTTPTMPASTRKTRTTFFSIPRELRQKILYLSCDLEIKIHDHPLNPDYRGVTVFDRVYGVPYRSVITELSARNEKKRSKAWGGVLTLGLSAAVEKDVEYVVHKWIMETDGMAEECKQMFACLEVVMKECGDSSNSWAVAGKWLASPSMVHQRRELLNESLKRRYFLFFTCQ